MLLPSRGAPSPPQLPGEIDDQSRMWKEGYENVWHCDQKIQNVIKTSQLNVQNIYMYIYIYIYNVQCANWLWRVTDLTPNFDSRGSALTWLCSLGSSVDPLCADACWCWYTNGFWCLEGTQEYLLGLHKLNALSYAEKYWKVIAFWGGQSLYMLWCTVSPQLDPPLVK